MWYPDEINYGGFALARARDGTNDIYMLARPDGAFGIKVARVAEATIADRSKYTYWDGSSWTATPPSATDKTANIFNYDVGGYGVGDGVSSFLLSESNNHSADFRLQDLFWSVYYNTWLAVFNDGLAPDDTFRMMYSTNGEIVGPWSTVSQDIYVSKACSGDCSTTYNYASHAYPDFDSTGKVRNATLP